MSDLSMFVRNNKLNIAISLFLAVFMAIHYAKPHILYMDDGSFRQFGVGYRNKTVIPIWLVAIILAIFCYLAVMFYIMHIA